MLLEQTLLKTDIRLAKDALTDIENHPRTDDPAELYGMIGKLSSVLEDLIGSAEKALREMKIVTGGDR